MEQQQIQMYDLLNKILSATYSCLRIGDQNKPQTSAGVFYAEDIFGKNKGVTGWVDTKLKIAASNRNNFLSAFKTAKSMMDSIF